MQNHWFVSCCSCSRLHPNPIVPRLNTLMVNGCLKPWNVCFYQLSFYYSSRKFRFEVNNQSLKSFWSSTMLINATKSCNFSKRLKNQQQCSNIFTEINGKKSMEHFVFESVCLPNNSVLHMLAIELFSPLLEYCVKMVLQLSH